MAKAPRVRGQDRALVELMAGWFEDPALFYQEVIGWEPETWQAEANAALADGKNRLAIRSGNGVGKTHWLAATAMWFGCTRPPDSKIGLTSPATAQIETAFWPEFRKIHAQMKRNGPVGKWLADQIDIKGESIDFGSNRILVARTARKEQPEAIQGLHAEHVLVEVDEASGVVQEIMDRLLGFCSTPNAILVLTGNPTRMNGYFYECFHKLAGAYWRKQVNSEDIPRARGHCKDIEQLYGKDSNPYRVQVLGEFPTHAEQQLIPLELIESAIRREVAPLTRFKPVWGLDVARFGDDKTTLCKRRGNTILEPIKFWRNKDIMQVAGLVMNEYRTTLDEDKPSEILVDNIGLGAGVEDRLRELAMPVRGVNVGESASDSEQYLRKRDELWFRTRDWFMARDCKMPNQPELLAELVAVKYDFTSSGKAFVDSKSDMKKELGYSPDFADSLVLTMAGGLDRIPDEEMDRWRKNEKKSWWRRGQKHTSSWMRM
jgi:hypothetical protein